MKNSRTILLGALMFALSAMPMMASTVIHEPAAPTLTALDYQVIQETVVGSVDVTPLFATVDDTVLPAYVQEAVYSPPGSSGKGSLLGMPDSFYRTTDSEDDPGGDSALATRLMRVSDTVYSQSNFIRVGPAVTI